MDDKDKAIAYYRAGAQQGTTGERPPFVPLMVCVEHQVCGDFPFSDTIVRPGYHKCESNQFGAISVKAENGKMLGLKLNEFEPVEWVENPHL